MKKKLTRKKISLFGKSLVLPSATLAFVFVAAGSAVTVATTGTPTSTTTQAQLVPDTRLADFCAEYWGELDTRGRVCRFNQWFHLNLRHAGTNAVLTAIPILPGDILRVEATSIPEALIGGIPYDASEEKVFARNPGYLAFRAPQGQGFFSVERLGLERCFGDSAGKIDTVRCPD